jgi:hypothetical protein
MSSDLEKHKRALDRIFRQARNKHEAQRWSVSLLQDMAADERVLSAVLERHVSKPKNLNTLNFPSLGFEVASNAHYTLVVNTFFPHPDGLTDLTFNSVHHHGEMLLTTVSAFGPGYEHWLFTTPQSIDPERDLFSIRLVERALHPKGHSAFVDAFIPHAVMFPRSLTVTYALWSHRRPVGWRDRIKRLPIFAGREKKLRAVALKLGLRHALDLKVPNYYDYYPVTGGFCGMRERQQFERGPNADYLESLFSILQSTNNEHLVRVIERTVERGGVDDPQKVHELASRMQKGDVIMPKFSKGLHLGIPHMNFKAEAILRTVA